MPAYAYRWADGSVSLCNADDETEALELLDRISGVSTEALVELENPILITLRPSIHHGWVFDESDPIDGDFGNELQEKIYPRYDKAFWKIVENEPSVPPDKFTDDQCALLEKALQKDINEAQEIERLIESRLKIALAADERAKKEKS
jgi:hypothetical protein